MFRLRNLKGSLGLCVAVVLVVLVNVAVSGGPTPAASQTPSSERLAPAPADCLQAPEASPFEALDGGACKVEPTADAIREVLSAHGGRTCRCSCGFPCKTDADCGGGVGSCRGGISCC